MLQRYIRMLVDPICNRIDYTTRVAFLGAVARDGLNTPIPSGYAKKSQHLGAIQEGLRDTIDAKFMNRSMSGSEVLGDLQLLGYVELEGLLDPGPQGTRCGMDQYHVQRGAYLVLVCHVTSRVGFRTSQGE